MRETVGKKACDQSVESEDHLLFGSQRTTVDLSTSQPNPVQIFRLWHIYLDNLNPLLNVTHILSLQERMTEAASKVTNFNPMLEALMFSIYCTSILWIAAENSDLAQFLTLCRPCLASHFAVLNAWVFTTNRP